MKKKTIHAIMALSMVPSLCSAESTEQQWHLLDFGSGHPAIFQGNKGTFSEFYVGSDFVGGKFGPIAIWQPEGSKDFVSISQSLSGVDEAFRAEGRARGTKATAVVMEYLHLYRGSERSYVLIGPDRDAYLTQLKLSTSKEIYEKAHALISDETHSTTSDAWDLSFTVVTWRGAIERRSYSGGLQPVSIRKETVEILAPAGTLPAFGFNPALTADEFNKSRKKQ